MNKKNYLSQKTLVQNDSSVNILKIIKINKEVKKYNHFFNK